MNYCGDLATNALNCTLLRSFYSLYLLVKFEEDMKILIEETRVARLATVDGVQPHLVPVVFVFADERFFIPLDEKSKSIRSDELRRVKNIRRNPKVALLIDKYEEDWTKLFFLMVQGSASIIGKGHLQLLTKVHKLLFAKYHQYKKVGIGESCIMIEPTKVIYWKNK